MNIVVLVYFFVYKDITIIEHKKQFDENVFFHKLL